LNTKFCLVHLLLAILLGLDLLGLLINFINILLLDLGLNLLFVITLLVVIFDLKACEVVDVLLLLAPLLIG
jgi:hypothetical protein